MEKIFQQKIPVWNNNKVAENITTESRCIWFIRSVSRFSFVTLYACMYKWKKLPGKQQAAQTEIQRLINHDAVCVCCLHAKRLIYV